MDTRRIVTVLATIAVVGGLVVAALKLGSGPSGRATGVFAGLALIPAAEVADTGSLAVEVVVPAELRLTELRLLLDGELIARDEQISSPVILDTRGIEDGDHVLRLCARSGEVGEGCTEAGFFSQHPDVELVGYELPESVANGEELVITVHTAGETSDVEADFSSFDSSFVPSDVLAEPVGGGSYRIRYLVPDDADGGEGQHGIPMVVHGAGGSRLVTNGPEIGLAQYSILPIRVPTGLLDQTTYDDHEDPLHECWVVQVGRSVTLDPGNEVLLPVDIEGNRLNSAQLVVTMDGFSGMLRVPVAGLELETTGRPPAVEGPDSYGTRHYDLPIHLLANSAFALGLGSGTIRVAMIDQAGARSASLASAASTRSPPPPPAAKNVVYGVAEYELPEVGGCRTSRSLASLLLQVLDARGTTRGFARCSAKGAYRVEYEVVSDPARLPYSLQVSADSEVAETMPNESDTVYTYTAATWDPTGVREKRVDFRIPLAQSAPFHIASMIRYGLHWARAHGVTTPPVDARWSASRAADCGGPSSCTIVTEGEIRISGRDDEPDQWDSPVILHEVGHWIMNAMRVDDSEGGVHTFEHRSDPPLAWSEGAATYIGQRALNNLWYVDQHWWGKTKRSILDLNGIDLGLDGGKHSEWVVASFLWSLEDGRSAARHDQIESWEPRTVAVLRGLDQSGDFSAGVPDAMDTLDFVRALVCRAPAEDYDRVYDLLTRRFQIDWLAEPELCD